MPEGSDALSFKKQSDGSSETWLQLPPSFSCSSKYHQESCPEEQAGEQGAERHSHVHTNDSTSSLCTLTHRRGKIVMKKHLHPAIWSHAMSLIMQCFVVVHSVVLFMTSLQTLKYNLWTARWRLYIYIYSFSRHFKPKRLPRESFTKCIGHW